MIFIRTRKLVCFIIYYSSSTSIGCCISFHCAICSIIHIRSIFKRFSPRLKKRIQIRMKYSHSTRIWLKTWRSFKAWWIIRSKYLKWRNQIRWKLKSIIRVWVLNCDAFYLIGASTWTENAQIFGVKMLLLSRKCYWPAHIGTNEESVILRS